MPAIESPVGWDEPHPTSNTTRGSTFPSMLAMLAFLRWSAHARRELRPSPRAHLAAWTSPTSSWLSGWSRAPLPSTYQLAPWGSHSASSLKMPLNCGFDELWEEVVEPAPRPEAEDFFCLADVRLPPHAVVVSLTVHLAAWH